MRLEDCSSCAVLNPSNVVYDGLIARLDLFVPIACVFWIIVFIYFYRGVLTSRSDRSSSIYTLPANTTTSPSVSATKPPISGPTRESLLTCMLLPWGPVRAWYNRSVVIGCIVRPYSLQRRIDARGLYGSHIVELIVALNAFKKEPACDVNERYIVQLQTRIGELRQRNVIGQSAGARDYAHEALANSQVE